MLFINRTIKKPSCKLTQWTQRGLLHILDNHHRHHYCYHIQECDLNHHPHHHHDHDHHCQPPHQGNKEVGVADLTLVLIVLLIFPSTAGQVQTLAHLQHNRFKCQKSKERRYFKINLISRTFLTLMPRFMTSFLARASLSLICSIWKRANLVFP